MQRWPIFEAFEEMGYDVASHVCCLGFYNPDNTKDLRGHTGLHPLNLSGCVDNSKGLREFREVCKQVSLSLGLRRGQPWAIEVQCCDYEFMSLCHHAFMLCQDLLGPGPGPGPRIPGPGPQGPGAGPGPPGPRARVRGPGPGHRRLLPDQVSQLGPGSA